MKRLACVALVCVLAGFCGCGQDEAGSAETTAITTEETAMPTESAPFEYAATKRIHGSLPEFTFTLYGQHNNRFPEDHWITINVIEISGEGFHQRLDGFETDGPFYPEDYGLTFADFNGDGYLDIQLHKWMGGSMGNEPSLFWLWDNKRQHFVQNEQLEEISHENGISMTDDGRLAGYARAGAFGYGVSYYSYINGKFVEVERADVHPLDWDDIYNTIFVQDTYKRINGKMKLVSTEEVDFP